MSAKQPTPPPELSRRRLLQAGAAGAALASSPFAVNIVRAQPANIKIGFLDLAAPDLLRL